VSGVTCMSCHADSDPAALDAGQLQNKVQAVLPRPRHRAFSHAGPAAWNALPDHIRTVADPVKFRKLLKLHYFSQAFNIC